MKILIAAFILVMLSACTISDDKNFDISGYVYETNGELVKDAGIVISYYLELNGSRPEAYFAYEVPYSANVKAWITRSSNNENIFTLIDEHKEAGQYAIIWHGTNSEGIAVISGYYTFHLLINNEESTQKFFLNCSYVNSHGTDVEVYATTDDYGYFAISQQDLAFNHAENEMEIFDENGNYIGMGYVTRTIDIWAVHTQYNAVCLDSVYIYDKGVSDLKIYFDSD
ncbi:MAG: hypothetical protein K9N06_03715 [Candidatus Cloacimonetes bacterium]|nr:hypothetical protein [Candidatus Cloacimonadota bacterium]